MLHQVGVSFDLYYDARKHKIHLRICEEYFFLLPHEFLNKGSVFFSFRETVIFVVSQASLKLVGTTSGSNNWISGRRKIFIRHEANTKFVVAR